MTMHSFSKLDYYNKYKTQFGFEKYLEVVTNEGLRKEMSCFRLGSHKLEIELGRYAGVERSDRLCKLCSCRQIESEFHFLLCCPMYSVCRHKYFGTTSWPTVQKCVNIMSCTNNKLLKTAKYLRDAFKIRSEQLLSMVES